MKFTSNQAIRICERKLKSDYRLIGSYDCYYNDTGRCELGFNCTGRCMDYKNDISFTNTVRENILKDPMWCKHNWNRLCRTDKDLFIAIYGNGNWR